MMRGSGWLRWCWLPAFMAWEGVAALSVVLRLIGRGVGVIVGLFLCLLWRV